MTIYLDPQIESQRIEVALSEGIEPTQLVEDLLMEHLPRRAEKDREHTRRAKLVVEIMNETAEMGLYP